MTAMSTGAAGTVSAAAEAVAAVLPAAEPLVAGDPQPATEHVTGLFAGAVVTEMTGRLSGRVAVLVGEDLVEALKSSPLGGLDLAAAVQPALDAVAASFGAGAGAARQVDLELVLSDLGGPTTVVPFIGSSISAALLVPDALLAAAAAPAPPAGAGPASGMGGGAAGGMGGGAAGGMAGGMAGATPAGLPQVPAAVPMAAPLPQLGAPRGIEMLHGVEMELTVELGRARMPVRDLLALAPGAVLELDRAAGSPADLLVNGRLIARGEVVVVDEDFGLRITEILDDSAAV